MAHVSVVFISLFLSLFSATKNIERAFFLDDSHIIYSLLSSRNHINISLPEPLSFSDQISSEQAFFLFKQIFTSFSTFEFYPESQLPLFPERTFIFKARWSFRNNRTSDQYVLQVFMVLLNEGYSDRPPTYRPPIPEAKRGALSWKIMELKAEKL